MEKCPGTPMFYTTYLYLKIPLEQKSLKSMLHPRISPGNARGICPSHMRGISAIGQTTDDRDADIMMRALEMNSL